MSESSKLHPFFQPRRPKPTHAEEPIVDTPTRQTRQTTLLFAQKQQDLKEKESTIPEEKVEKKKPFVITKRPPATVPKLLSEEPLKSQCSNPLLRPYEQSAALSKEQEFDFYGPIKSKKTVRGRFDHEFARLDRNIYKHAHWPPIRRDDAIELTRVHQVTNAHHIKQLIHTRSISCFQSKKRQPKQPSYKTTKQKKIHGERELRAWLDRHYPEWHTFPSCTRLVRMILGPSIKSNQSWIDKYRPRTVDGLVGAKHNHVYLKNWLHQMKIEPATAPCRDEGNIKKHTKKKKKEMDDDLLLDGLSLDENKTNAFDRLMKKKKENDDSSDDDFVVSPAAVRKKAARQQHQGETVRSNMVLLVGYHGVGKTALVHTAAEQEGYEIFEINSGSRRSGKDVVSAVGEMTKSHLVTFQNNVSEEPQKKRRLNPFLSSKGMTNTTQGKGQLLNFVRKSNNGNNNKKLNLNRSADGPKQSLILLEEVDLLFEEDKGFWASVVELSQKSKRPIIMTCNDPDQIPFEMLYLQTVLDIQPPPLEELLPYLWLVCYAEGYQMDPADLVCLTALVGRDVRQLLQILELYRGVPHPFESYLSISPQMSMTELKSRSIPSKIAVDTYRLVHCFESVVHRDEDEDMAESSQESLEDILGALNNDGFIDVWAGSRERRLLVSFSRHTLINLIQKKKKDTNING
ncbi:P-loop containing nucleoside triphosphate hydrolase protein [Rhizopus microsporus var. microsporus]|uniref:P-loop containing nucleoside triphosphate hydrolase protein n=1 Tax=Rhizopus microsporus var. microsporus TaxID=86635 RepID=A0A1X0RF02_RHIZD|nr:P-loop containing nucleoside triphosphate hydrolase protein [Rhizopus microsporus var. microsporus]